MEKSVWKAILNRSQHEQLPLVTGCLFAIMVLLTLRDILNLGESESTWIYFMEYLTLTLSLLIWVASVVKLIPVNQAQNAVVVTLLCIALKAGASVLVWNATGPANVALTVFGAGLVLLSVPHLIFIQLFTLGFWLFAALMNLTSAQYLPIVAIALTGAVLGVVIQNRRLATIREIFELKHRVESLESILPMCAGCKKAKSEDGHWVSIESYIESHEENTVVTHGLCPDCKEANYGDFQMARNKRAETRKI